MPKETSKVFSKFLTLKVSIKEISTQKLMLPAIFAELIFTKNIYFKNDDLRKLTKDILNLEYKDYLFKSRTLLFSRVIKDKYINSSDEEIFKSLISIQDLIKKQEFNYTASKKVLTPSKNKKTSSQQQVISEWRKVIKSDD